MFQWHKGRADDLRRFARDNGTDWRDHKTQVAYLVHELDHDYPDLKERMNKAGSPEAAATMFAREFERPQKVREDRGQAARQFHDTGRVDEAKLSKAPAGGADILGRLRDSLRAFEQSAIKHFSIQAEAAEPVGRAKGAKGTVADKTETKPAEPGGSGGETPPPADTSHFDQFQAIGMSPEQTKELAKAWDTMPEADRRGFLRLLDNALSANKPKSPRDIAQEAIVGPTKTTEEYINKSLASVKALGEGATFGLAPVVEGVVRSGGHLSGPEYEAGVARARAPMEQQLSPSERMSTHLVGGLATSAALPLKVAAAIPAVESLAHTAGRGEDTLDRIRDAGKAETMGLGVMGTTTLLQLAKRYASGLLAGPETRAMTRYGETLRQSGATPETVAAKRAEIGPEAMALDTGGSGVRALARDTYKVVGVPQDTMKAALAARDAEMGTRLQAKIAEATGVSGQQYAADRAALIMQRRAVGRDEIDKVLEATPVIDANKMKALYREAPALAKEATRLKTEEPAFRTLPYNSSKLIDEAWNNIAGGWLKNSRDKIKPILEDAMPGWTEAHAKYAPIRQAEEAMDAGAKAVTQPTARTRADLERYADNPHLTAMYREGAANGLLELVSKNPDKTVRDVLGSGPLRDRLQIVMNDPRAFRTVYDEIVTQAEVAAANKIARSEGGQLPGAAGRPDFAPEVLGSAASGNTVGMIQAGARIFKNILAALTGKRSIDPREAQVLARVLTSKGAEIDNYAKQALAETGPSNFVAPKAAAVATGAATAQGVFDTQE